MELAYPASRNNSDNLHDFDTFFMDLRVHKGNHRIGAIQDKASPFVLHINVSAVNHAPLLISCYITRLN